MEQRIKTLKLVSGLKVKHRTVRGVNVFTFFLDPAHCLMEAFTYKKALYYAKGIAMGRMLVALQLLREEKI